MRFGGFGFNRQFGFSPVSASGGTAAEPPQPGNELWVQPGFDASTGITLGSWTIGSSQATNNAAQSNMFATALEELVAGTYRIEVDIASSDGSFRVGVAGTNTTDINGTGVQSRDIAVGSISHQLIIVGQFADEGITVVLNSLSVKKLG